MPRVLAHNNGLTPFCVLMCVWKCSQRRTAIFSAALRFVLRKWGKVRVEECGRSTCYYRLWGYSVHKHLGFSKLFLSEPVK